MECEICFEDKILNDDMTFFKCQHHICKICYNNLKKRLCPFCRRKIKILKNKQINDKQPEDNLYIEEDNDVVDNEEEYFSYVHFYNTRIRIKREYKRRSKEKSKIKLQKLLINETIKNNKYMKIIPNFKVKFQRKLKLFFNNIEA